MPRIRLTHELAPPCLEAREPEREISMSSQKVQVKLFTSGSPQFEPYLPVFHRWIRDNVLGAEWLSLRSNGTAETEFLVALITKITGAPPAGYEETLQQD